MSVLAFLPLLGLGLARPVPASQETPRSLFTAPLYLDSEPPATRAAAVILITGARGEREQAPDLVRRAREGEDFARLARSYSDGPEAAGGGVVGSFPPGVLEEAADRFLFAAEVGDVSDPIEGRRGLTIWRRIEARAASEHVLVPGVDATARARAAELARRARSGGDLESSASEGGLRYGRDVFERGPSDRLLKLATFECPPGEVFGPLETPLGFVVGRRIAPERVAPANREWNWIRARALVLRTPEDLSDAVRAHDHAEVRARIQELRSRVEKGQTLEALAKELTEEPTARARAGDLGWIHRRSPTRSRLLDALFVSAPGKVLDPLAFRGGWVLFERTR